ncbi:hypothetical protein QX776_13235 [Alteromonadaceae bacterium BrNp21-10]|nr:hypothetical protein [Alteromonadaceae bacterium BrNp21-10]
MQYQFLLDNLNHSDQIQDELVEQGISVDNIHFVSERSQDFAGHHVHEASIIEERDVVHSGVRGAIVGAVLGMAVSVGVYYLQPYGWQIEMLNVILIELLMIGFGGWIGGLFGISHRNYRISAFEPELQKGKAIMLVYAAKDVGERLQQMIESTHKDAKYLGVNAEFDNPLRSGKTAELMH